MTEISIRDEKVSKIVAESYKTAQVFTKYGIDFCCGGNVPLADVCRQKEIDIAALEKELVAVSGQPVERRFLEMGLSQLVNYIVNEHHTYVRQTAPVLAQYISKVSLVHGENHPEVIRIRELFEASRDELEAHMAKEENILFPFILKLEEALKNDSALPNALFGDIDNPIRMMRDDHEREGERFKEISALSNKYVPPKGACQTFQVAYAMLKDFEADLHKHIHLENNILFPKALAAFRKHRLPENPVV